MSLCILLSAEGMAGTIDPNQPLPESLKPDLLYLNFDQQETGQVTSQTEGEWVASLETGKVGEPPQEKPGPAAAFGKAMEFHYGKLPAFKESNPTTAGSHLRIADTPALQLVGESFTLGAWVQIPEGVELPAKAYKKILSKGGFSGHYPGWGFQISRHTGKEEVWRLILQLVDEAGNQASTQCSATLRGFTPGQWHHLAASFDASSQTISLWFDGALVFSGASPAGAGSSTFPLTIGENAMSSYGNIPLIMDEVFITSGVHDVLPVTP